MIKYIFAALITMPVFLKTLSFGIYLLKNNKKRGAIALFLLCFLLICTFVSV